MSLLLSKSPATRYVLPPKEGKSWSDDMGLIYAEVEIINGGDLELVRRGVTTDENTRRMTVTMLVDSGALMMAINETIQKQLGLSQVETKSAQLADGTLIELAIVSSVEIRFANRRASVDALVLPGDAEPLLGAIPMEYMDVLIDPRQQRLIVNPAHPYIAQSSLK
ncbi:MAG: clan AA aspartic protease [Pyrinomonadaceae bacterium MAG19_C2-C3]|nr:clan AA aspartic protease [Pyrinomonadaceae bacterium MAG19_C2-C3]